MARAGKTAAAVLLANAGIEIAPTGPTQKHAKR
jgi:hypothetical protein